MSEAMGAMKAAVLDRLRSETLAHAVLLDGPRGSGKSEAALWIGRAAVCEGKKPPCGTCEACRSFEGLSDLDLLVLRPIDRPVWVERERAESFFPGGVREALDRIAGEGFLRAPIPDPVSRPLLPLRLDPSSFLRRTKGSPRLDRNAFEARLEASSLEDAEKAFVRETARPGLSLEWYISTIGIGLMTGAGEGGGLGGRSGILPFLGRRPAARRRKVVVVEEADRMTEEAENALLKTLEEPPPGSFLLLTTSRREALLDTIRSRCERIRVRPPPPDETKRAAARFFHAIDPEEWKSLLLLGEGVPRQAAEIDLDLFREERKKAEDLFQRAASSPVAEYALALGTWAEEVEETGAPETLAADRLSLFLLLARERAVRASAEGPAGDAPFAAAERVFAFAHGALSGARPGTNSRLLLEEFGVELRRLLRAAAGGKG
jgi:hypothetical protein